MLDHIGIHVRDFRRAKEFYTSTLKPFGYSLQKEIAEWNVAGFGTEGGPDFWVSQGESMGEIHIAFVARDKATVDAFHKAGIAAGGTDNGAPGYRKDYAPGYYGAFVKDFDGNNIEAVFHDPHPSE